MNRCGVDLLGLPNEILFYILRKLDNVDVLYSLFGINNARLDSITQEETFSDVLHFTLTMDNTRMMNLMLDRFCHHILPQVSFNLKRLIIDVTFMERILLLTQYPNLTELKLLNFQHDNSVHYLTDNSPLQCVFKEQITKLDLVITDRDRTIPSWEEYTKEVYARIFSAFSKLEHLNLIQTLVLSSCPHLLFPSSPSDIFSSSNLTHLRISVATFNDCLHLLDGRLKQLNTLILEVAFLDANVPIIHNSNDLSNLKCFSFIHYVVIKEYDNTIALLLRRMLHLEKLTLYLRIGRQDVFTDPVNLINEISMHMSRLSSFNFHLSVLNNKNDLAHHLSNNDPKRNLTNKGYEEVLDMVCDRVEGSVYQVFTVPFEFIRLMSVGYIFPNIVFKYVIDLWINITVTYEHEFFLRVVHAFPMLKYLCISAFTPYSYGPKKPLINSQPHEPIEYRHLISLDIMRTDTNYVEHFLNETHSYLPYLTELIVGYEDLRIITEDYTRETTRRNCANVTRLINWRVIAGSKDYYNHFPRL